MKRSIGISEFFGFAAVSLGGTLLHFLYDWSGEAIWLAPFSGVNESTWEHMKLLFFPMFVFAVLQRRFFLEHGHFWCIKLRGTLLGLVLIPVIFYTYNGAIAPSPDWLNIAIFFVSAAISYVYETRLFYKKEGHCTLSKGAFALLCLIGLFFVIFTFFPPRLGIFRDPVSGSFGI